MNYTMHLHNGIISTLDAQNISLPPEVIVQSLEDALQTRSSLVEPYLAELLKERDARFSAGLLIYIPENVILNTPISLIHWQDNIEQAVDILHLAIISKGARLTLIEDYAGDAKASYRLYTMTHACVGENAEFCHYKIQQEGQLAHHEGHLGVLQDASSRFESHVYSGGSKWARSDITVSMRGPHARCILNGIYAPNLGQTLEQYTQIDHQASDCDSMQDYKGVLQADGRAVFEGKIVVAKDTVKNSAKQQNKNLLLSAKANAESRPQLDIFSDDVICTHGATIGQLEEEALFYLESRGINRLEASKFLVEAFTAHNWRMVAESMVAEKMKKLFYSQLAL